MPEVLPAPAVQTIAVPSDLVERDQWVLWRAELVGQQRRTKVPYCARGLIAQAAAAAAAGRSDTSVAARKASTTDPRTWAPLDSVLQVWGRWPEKYTGIGFVFVKGQRLVGIDLDNCLEASGAVKEWARGTVERFFDCYSEISPSGRGLKIWVRGELPANLPGTRIADGAIEVYDHARYFTFTGQVFRGAPLEIQDHSADLRLLYEHLMPRRKVWPLQPLAGGRIPHGQQHSTLVSIAGTLRARRVCDAAIEACLQAVNSHQCERPGTPAAISKIVHSTRSWSAK